MVFTGESNKIPFEKNNFKRKSQHGAAFIIEAIAFAKENRFTSIIQKDGSKMVHEALWFFFYCSHNPIR